MSGVSLNLNGNTKAIVKFNSVCKTVKDHYGIDDDKMKEIIKTCFRENPLGLKNVAMYGDFSKIRLAIPVLLKQTESPKVRKFERFGNAY